MGEHLSVAFEYIEDVDRQHKWGIAPVAAGSLFIIEELRKAFFPRLYTLGKWQPLRSASKKQPGQ
ncbi:hypothetical protein ACFLUJ_07170 [Chloroflexota bacterium]